MLSPLPNAWDLITDSWRAFTKTWDTTVRISAWFIATGILQAAGGIMLERGNAGAAVTVICMLLAGFLAICLTIALYRAVLGLERGQTPKTDPKDIWMDARSLILPLLLVGLLQGLAVFGATLLFVIPGIYMGIRLGFSQLVLIEKGLRGRAALAESWTLTKDRFWALFGRQLAGGALFGFGIGMLVAVAVIIVMLLAGPAFADTITQEDNATGNGVITIISSIIQAAFVPLMVIFQVKLLRALERGRA